jgi:hypothetical protein
MFFLLLLLTQAVGCVVNETACNSDGRLCPWKIGFTTHSFGMFFSPSQLTEFGYYLWVHLINTEYDDLQSRYGLLIGIMFELKSFFNGLYLLGDKTYCVVPVVYDIGADSIGEAVSNARQAYRRLIDVDNVHALLGPVSVSPELCAAAAEEASKNDTLLFVSSSVPALFDFGYEYLFSSVSLLTSEVHEMVSILFQQSRNSKYGILFNSNDTLSLLYANAYLEELQSYAIEPVYLANFSELPNNNISSISLSEIAKMKSAGVDTLIIADCIAQNFPFFARALVENEFAPKAAVITSTIYNFQMEQIGSASNYWLSMNTWHDQIFLSGNHFAYGDLGSSFDYRDNYASYAFDSPFGIAAAASGAAFLLQLGVLAAQTINSSLIVRDAILALNINSSFFSGFRISESGFNQAHRWVLSQVLNQWNEAVNISSIVYPAEFAWRSSLIPCSITGCGRRAKCLRPEDACTCNAGFVPFDTAQVFDCVPPPVDIASQRIFWIITMCSCFLGSLLSGFIIYVYVRDWSKLSTSINISFLARVVPDFILSLSYLVSQFINLLAGTMLNERSCEVLSFITYGFVFASFAGPCIVAFVMFMKLRLVVVYNQFTDEPFSVSQMIIILIVPWIVGMALAGVVKYKNLLGSFRDLYCYTSDWDSFLTGGLTMLFLVFFCLMTAGFYIGINIYAHSKKSKQKKTDSKKTVIIKKGASLIFGFIICWFLWALCGFLNSIGKPPSQWMEVLGGIMITFSPIADFCVMFSMPSLRTKFAKYVARFRRGEPLKISKTFSNNNSSAHSAKNSKNSLARPSITRLATSKLVSSSTTRPESITE